MLFPGLAQMAWGQRQRGLVLLVTFASSLSMSLFCWGSLLGWGFLAFAFVTHTFSLLDALHQRSFPSFPRVLASVATMVAMGLLLYLPLAMLLELYAFPALSNNALGTGYLVNRLAYEGALPRAGDWVWLRLSPTTSSRAGRVVAVAGQEVEWTGRGWLVDGQAVNSQLGSFPYYPKNWRFRVPEHHVLIGPEGDAARTEPIAPLIIVGHDQIVGRAWARYYPFWDRCLL
jgi:hypothetical protein